MTLQRRLAVAVAALLVTLVVAGGLVLLSQRRYVTRQLDAQVAALVARPPATLTLAERAAAGARGGVLSEVWIGTVAPTGAVTTVLAPAGDPGLLPRVAPGEVLRVPVGRSTTAGDAPRVRVATGPLKGGTLLVVAVPTQRADAAMGRLALTLALAGAAVLLVVGAIVVWVRRLGLAPIREMTQAADAITAGERDRRIPDAPEGSEAAHLGDALNAMLDATRDSEDRMRQFVADASHELRTPLTTLRGYAELHADRVEDPDTADALRRIRAEATRMHRLVEDLLTLTSLDRATLHLGPVDVRRLLDDVASDLQVAQPERLVTVETAPGVRLVADEDRLTQAVMALGTNALRHTPVTASVRLTAYATGGEVVVEVSDDGPGIPQEELTRVWDRFARVSPGRAGGGTGLGLAIVAGIVTAHGGRYAALSPPEGGVTFRLVLPAGSQAEGPDRVSAGQSPKANWSG